MSRGRVLGPRTAVMVAAVGNGAGGSSRVVVMAPTRSAAVAESHLGIDRSDGNLPDRRQLVLPTDFSVDYQSLARLDGVSPVVVLADTRVYTVIAKWAAGRSVEVLPASEVTGWVPSEARIRRVLSRVVGAALAAAVGAFVWTRGSPRCC